MKIQRHHIRLDENTEAALRTISKATLQTKASVMRRYIQEGVGRDITPSSLCSSTAHLK